ncbi:MAG: extracellular solute-binding protein [Alphaproteobacteria bacterium]|nr:extracellular solute-binding protein [Alphaproteobacteria bacterium]
MNALKQVMLGAATLALVTTLAPAPPVKGEEITIKLWSRADRSGPLRAGNIVRAAELLNKQLAAAGADRRIAVEVHENNAKGYDDDALDLFKAFAVDKGPDVYVTAHEWVAAFAEAGYAMNLEAHIARYPEYYGDVIEVLWQATLYEGARYAVPQDSEIRMFFYRKDLLREIGKSEAFIEGLPAMVERGAFTIWELSALAREVVEGTEAQYGIIHRPNVGPDFLMILASFGFDPFDERSGKLQASRAALTEFLRWIAHNVEQGVTPANNTALSWDTVNVLLPQGKAFIKLHGVWDVPRQIRYGISEDTAEAYFKTVGWLHAPPAKRGGAPANLSHPIVYLVNPRSPNAELAALLVAIASQSYFNTGHAVSTGHTAITHGQTAMPAYRAAWALQAATPMLARSIFMPNHPGIGLFNAAIFKGLQGVETGRLAPEEGARFIIDELEAELGDEVVIVD